MSAADSVDDLHAAEDFAGIAAMVCRQLVDVIAAWPDVDAEQREAALKNSRYVIEQWASYCRPTCGAEGVAGACEDDDPECCGCPCDHGTPTADETIATVPVVVKQGWFWMLPDEVGAKQVKFCPKGGVHEVDEDGEDG